eukprot:878136-Pyramimonas_sp.AAC.1
MRAVQTLVVHRPVQASRPIPTPCLRHVQRRRLPWTHDDGAVNELRRARKIRLTQLRVALPAARQQGDSVPSLFVFQMHVVLLPLLQ